MMLTVLGQVYSRPLYGLVTVAVAIVTLTVIVIVPNYSVVLAVFLSPVVSILSKITFFVTLYGSLATNYSVLAAISVVMIAVLFGVNAALLLYYMRQARVRSKRLAGATTTSGIFGALFGVGCAACGSAVAATVLNLLGIGWIVSYLPLHGAEFGLLGVMLLLVTTYTLLRRLADPQVCNVAN